MYIEAERKSAGSQIPMQSDRLLHANFEMIIAYIFKLELATKWARLKMGRRDVGQEGAPGRIGGSPKPREF
jgi:hypothetical protein